MSKSVNPFRYFNSSPEVIRLAVQMYVRHPPSLRSAEDLLFEMGIDICHETVRFWWNRFGPMFAAEIRRRRLKRMRGFRHWRWHLDEVFVKINGTRHYRGGSVCLNRDWQGISGSSAGCFLKMQIWVSCRAGEVRPE